MIEISPLKFWPQRNMCLEVFRLIYLTGEDDSEQKNTIRNKIKNVRRASYS